MKTYRIHYSIIKNNVIEVEAGSPVEAWKAIKSQKLEPSKVVWEKEGKVHYKVEKTEEITKHIASSPS